MGVHSPVRQVRAQRVCQYALLGPWYGEVRAGTFIRVPRVNRRNISQSGAAPADLAKLGRIEADQTHEASHKAKQPWPTWQKPWQQPWQQARKYSGSAAQRKPSRQHRRTTAGSRHQETRTSEQKSASTHLQTKNMEPLQMYTHMYVYKRQRRNKAVKATQSR